MPTTIKRRRPKGIALTAIPALNHRAILARRLDLMADLELQHGHHRQAEHLAHRAAQLREGAQ